MSDDFIVTKVDNIKTPISLSKRNEIALRILDNLILSGFKDHTVEVAFSLADKFLKLSKEGNI